jgi:hypothetical protein
MAVRFHPDSRAALLASFVHIFTHKACSILERAHLIERGLSSTTANATGVGR